MKVFSFIISVIAFLALLAFIIFEFPGFDNASDIIFFMMLFILVVMSVTGIFINMPAFSRSQTQKRLKNNRKHMHA